MSEKIRNKGRLSAKDACPKCGKSLTVRIGPHGRYLGCSAYPRCDFSYFGAIGSILVDETETMERERRLAEQAGHRKRARVHAREHQERQEVRQQMALEGEMQQNILQHPALNSQRFDGIDPSVNPEPTVNTEARREFDNERREQEKEKQLRLGNMPKFSNAPKPQGPL
jgi:ssDNA-binding Zn-finger/Zn-ribbon topoisomerase 1